MTAEVIDFEFGSKNFIKNKIKKNFSNCNMVGLADNFIKWCDFDHSESSRCIDVLKSFNDFLKGYDLDIVAFANYLIDKPVLKSQKKIICEFFIECSTEENFDIMSYVISQFSNCLIIKRTNGIIIRDRD